MRHTRQILLALPVYFTSLAMLVGVLPSDRRLLGAELWRHGWWPEDPMAAHAVEAAAGA